MAQRMHNQKPITGTLTAGATTTTGAINLSSLGADGYFSIQVLLTGDGTLKIEYMISNVTNETGGPPLDAQFLTPTGASDIITAHTKTSGPGSDGLDLYQFPGTGEPIFGKWLKLKLTETGGANTVTYTIYDNIQ